MGFILISKRKKFFKKFYKNSQKTCKENSSLMIIGENLEENKEPGKLLNKILSAMGTHKE